MSVAIETHQLVKKFGNVTAVDGLSLQVDQGEIYAFLGLNGAGKTTTIRMLMGMIKPTSGHARVRGWECGLCSAWPGDSVRQEGASHPPTSTVDGQKKP